MFKLPCSKSYLLALMAILPTLYWHIRNSTYELNDAGDYMCSSQVNYLALKQVPVLRALNFVANQNRGHKPILHPLIGTGLLFITNGNTRIAVKIFTLTALFLLALVLFATARLFTGPLPAALITLLIAWSPWVYASSQSFNSELPLITASFAAIYFYIRDRLSPTKKYLSLFLFFLSASIMTRPIEASFFLGPFFLASIWRRARSGEISTRQLGLLSLLIVCSIATLAAPQLALGRSYSFWEMFALYFLLCLLIGGFVFIFSRKTLFSFSVYNLSILSIVFFYLISSQQLGHWIFDTSIGPLAQNTGQFTSEIYNFYFLDMFKGYMNLSLVLAGLALFFFVFAEKKKIPSLDWPPCLCAIIFLPIIACYGQNSEPRYYYLNFLFAFFLLSLCIFSFRIHKFWKIIRSLVFGAVVLPIPAGGLGFSGIQNTATMKIFDFWGHYSFPLHAKTSEKMVSFVNKLEKIFPIGANILYIMKSSPIHNESNLWAITLYARERSLDWHFFHYRPSNFFYNDQELRELIDRNDFVLLGPVEGRSDKHTLISGPVADAIMNGLKSDNRVAEFGLSEPHRISIPSGNSFEHFYSFKTRKQGPLQGLKAHWGAP